MSDHVHKRDLWTGYPRVRCWPISPTVCIRRAGRSGKPERYISGYIIAHHVELKAYRCEGFVCIDPEVAVQREDGSGLKLWTATGDIERGTLTLSPSIECNRHKEFHAYVVDGKWTGG